MSVIEYGDGNWFPIIQQTTANWVIYEYVVGGLLLQHALYDIRRIGG